MIHNIIHLLYIIYVLSTCTGVDENVVKVVEGAADAVENQVDAGRDATLAGRLKMAGTYYNNNDLEQNQYYDLAMACTSLS